MKNLPKVKPSNIWSGSRTLAVLTNPTEIAFRKGTLRKHYPVVWGGVKFKDSESLYQHLSRNCKKDKLSCYHACTTALIAKFKSHPFLVDFITLNGGIKWLEQCSHFVNHRSPRWEGYGRNSGFIRCLVEAYEVCRLSQIARNFQRRNP